MKNLKVFSSTLLIMLVVVLGGLLFTSNTTIEKSDRETIAELTEELIDLKMEMKALESEMEVRTTVGPDPYMAEIVLFAGNFAPRGWAFCEGQELAISQHSSLFSLLGTTYGGDGRLMFKLPNMKARELDGGPRHIIALTGIYPSRR